MCTDNFSFDFKINKTEFQNQGARNNYWGLGIIYIPFVYVMRVENKNTFCRL